MSAISSTVRLNPEDGAGNVGDEMDFMLQRLLGLWPAAGGSIPKPMRNRRLRYRLLFHWR